MSQINQNKDSYASLAKKKHGAWSKRELKIFRKALKRFGKDFAKIAEMVRTRDVPQIRSHHQKYEQKKRNNKERIGYKKQTLLREPNDAAITRSKKTIPVDNPQLISDDTFEEEDSQSISQSQESISLSFIQKKPQISKRIIQKKQPHTVLFPQITYQNCLRFKPECDIPTYLFEFPKSYLTISSNSALCFYNYSTDQQPKNLAIYQGHLGLTYSL